MPLDLKNLVESAANAAGRSLNAEIVARVEASFITERESKNLISAKRAKELALMARNNLPDEIRNRVISSIGRAVTLGHSSTNVDLKDLSLDEGLSDEELDELTKTIDRELISAGYRVEWDGGSWIWIEF